VLIVDECRRTGSQSEALVALFTARITAQDCIIATGPAYAATLPSRDGIVEAALELVGADSQAASD
jgi:2-oxoisovalerate dehydrogenase E1 component